MKTVDLTIRHIIKICEENKCITCPLYHSLIECWRFDKRHKNADSYDVNTLLSEEIQIIDWSDFDKDIVSACRKYKGIATISLDTYDIPIFEDPLESQVTVLSVSYRDMHREYRIHSGQCKKELSEIIYGK